MNMWRLETRCVGSRHRGVRERVPTEQATPLGRRVRGRHRRHRHTPFPAARAKPIPKFVSRPGYVDARAQGPQEIRAPSTLSSPISG
jgi:hypothetical protein